MRKFVLLILFLMLLVSGNSLQAQNGTVSGVVKDAKTGEPLTGATVELMGAKKQTGRIGAITSKDGSYKIRMIPPGDYKLKAVYIGYKAYLKDVTVEADETLTENIELFPDIVGLDEVVVTGVASRNEKAVADVAVARVNAADLQDSYVYQGFGSLMTGKIPGVQISSSSGNVGGGLRFHVRGGGGLNGGGQPLIYVDGVRINNDNIGLDVGGQTAGTISDLNPEDIANIEVLKGPAGAALYGTSGSNGVVLITTRTGMKGKAGDAFRMNYKAVTGWNEQAVEYSEDDIVSADAANDVYRQGGISQQTLSVAGRSGIFSYYGSFTDRSEEGIVYQNNFDRFSTRANFDAVPNDELKLSISTNYIVSENKRPQNDNNIQGWMGNTILYHTPYAFTDSSAISALSNTINSNRFIGSANLTYTPNWLPGLSFNGMVGVDAIDYTNVAFSPPGFFYPGIELKGEKTSLSRMRRQMNYEFNAGYAYDITGAISAVTTVGTQLFNNYTKYAEVTMQNFGSKKVTNLNGATDFIVSDDGIADFKEAGIFFNQDFNFYDRYFLTLGMRNDYSSVIGEEAPSIFYPRVSGAVRLDRFGWDMGPVNFMKFRAGYGQNGQLPGLLSAYPLRWGGGQSGFGVGALITSIGNQAIEPERIQEYEVGLETEFFNAYGFDFTYYYSFAEESIIGFPNPPSSGLTATNVPTNVGEVVSWGFESMFYASPIIKENYQLDLSLILNYSENEIQSLGGAQPIVGSFGELGWFPNQPRSAFMTNKVVGALFDPETGQYLGPDVEEEISYAGTPIPVYTGSFSIDFRFLKYFSVGMLWEFAAGHKVSNQTRTFQINYGNDVEYNELQEELAGLEPGTAEYEEVATEIAMLNPNWAYNFIEEGDWIRLRELSFRVNATEWITDLLGETYIKRFNVLMSASNVLLFTNYSGVDPEVNFSGTGTNVTRGVDFLTMQHPRTFNFQVNIGF